MNIYEVTFRDSSMIELSEAQGERIKQAWIDGKRQTPFGVDGNAYLIGDIKRIQLSSRLDYKPESTRVIEGNKCQGKRSIQLEISRRIRLEYGKDWAKPMRDHDLRSTYRLEIIEENPDEKWCDHVAKTCACRESSNEQMRITSWRDVFPDKVEVVGNRNDQ